MTVTESSAESDPLFSFESDESFNEKDKSLGVLLSSQGTPLKSYQLKAGKVFRIGRDPCSDIVLNHPAVSSCHCLIWTVQFDDKTSPIFFLKDTSLNGTFLNKDLVGKNKIVYLNDEDLLEIKFSISLRFRELDVCSLNRADDQICLPGSNWRITNKKLGYGTFGSVYIAERKNEPGKGKMYAVKVTKSQYTDHLGAQSKESSILKEINHPNIIRVYETVQSFNGQWFIFQDLVCGGDLYSYLAYDGYFHSISETESKLIMYQLFSAISYLHDRKIIHRDLKLDNILLETPQAYTRVFISDFGAAKQLPKSRTYTIIGTLEYCAPEVGLFKNKVPAQGYGKPCDVWSLGIILQIMLTGISPFAGILDGDQFSQAAEDLQSTIQSSDRFQNISNEAKSILSQMLTIDHYKRLTIAQCFSHKWITKHSEMLKLSHKMILESSTIDSS